MFVFPSIFNAKWADHQLFLINFHEVRHHELRKLMWPGFWKKKKWARRAQKVPKSPPKSGFLGFRQKHYPFGYAFLLQYEVANGLLTFCKSKMFGKNLGLGLWSENLKIIRMQDSFNHSIAQTSWCIKLKFWMWLELHKSNKY